MKTFWTIVRDGYNVNPSEIIKTRWATDEEKKKLTKAFKDIMVYGIEHHEINNLTYEDTEDLWKSGRHVCFSGGHNDAVIISEEDADRLIQMDKMLGRKKKVGDLKELIRIYKEELKFLSSQKLHSGKEAKEAAAEWRKTMNEGGDGYIPHFYTYEELERCKDNLAKAEKELRELEK